MKNSFKYMEPEQLEDMLSTFLINSWSYSKITSFARHEKAFEMNYIWGVYSKKSSSSIAGNAYHKALQYYFTKLKIDGEKIDIVEMEAAAFAYIEDVPVNQWKLQKTTPTIEEAKLDCTKTVVSLIKNFVSESAIYEDSISDILEVEIYGNEWVCVNGVEIPMPLHFQIDLVVKTKEGKIAIVDHKSKKSFTSEDELALGIGSQAISYVLGYEEKTSNKVDEVWFVENKTSKNKDSSAQLNRFIVKVDADTRALYEALLYEPLKRMVQAVRDADYVYLINPSDNFISLAEIHAFWARTQASEITIEDFNVDPGKKELISKRLKKIRDSSTTVVSPTILKSFRENASKFITYDLSNKNMNSQQKIEHVLRSFGTIVNVAHKQEGYSSDTFLLEISAGVPIKSLYSKRLDLANALDVENVRMSTDLVVFENKSYLAVEIKKKREKNLYYDSSLLEGMKIPLGIDNFGNLIKWDLENPSTPHQLVCGQTGSGKSVYIKSCIEYAKLAKMDDIIIFDPKYEFNNYSGKNIEVVNDIEDIETYMAMLVKQMNDLVKLGRKKMTLIVFDEFADAVANSRKGKALAGDKSLEENLRILLQKGRSSGFRIIAATQRASVKVITGDAKVNFPVQICFRVPKEQDSRVVLDEAGAESLAGFGDGLIKSPAIIGVTRFQAFYKPETITT